MQDYTKEAKRYPRRLRGLPPSTFYAGHTISFGWNHTHGWRATARIAGELMSCFSKESPEAALKKIADHIDFQTMGVAA